MNARSRGRLGLRLGLLYSRKATALAGAECGARGVEPGLIRPETRYALRLGKQALPLYTTAHSDTYGASGRLRAWSVPNTLDRSLAYS